MGNILLLQDTYPFELPAVPDDEKEIMNFDKKVDDQMWTRPGVPKGIMQWKPAKRQQWIEQEGTYCFDTGRWIFIKGVPYWLPPSFYFTLAWWYMDDGYMDFRYNQLLEDYFECFCEADPWCIGTTRFKKRRDGLTTRRMARMVWKAIQSRGAWFGIQSKTGTDAKKVCWKILMKGFRRLPNFFKPKMSGSTNPKTMLEFGLPSTRITKSNQEELFGAMFSNEEEDDDDNDTTMDYRDTVSDAYDGQKLKEATLDEFAKWKKASALDAYQTYVKSVTLDGKKVGMLHAISSPSEKDDQGHKESIEHWDNCDYHKIKDLQAWKSYRWFTSALDSYAGAIDQYGFSDRNKAYKLIMDERNSTVERKKKAVIRQTPMYIEEITEATENNVFANADAMIKRKKFLKSIEFKDVESKDPKYIFGNLDWVDAIEDTTLEFKPADNQEDFSYQGRFAVAHMPAPGTNVELRFKMHKGQLIVLPPEAAEFTMGVDPYDFKRTDSDKPSRGAATAIKTFDFTGNGELNQMPFMYDYRTKDPNVFYEDMIKGCVFWGCMMNPEAKNMKLVDWFELRGYFDWVLAKDPMNKRKKEIKGTPTTVNITNEGCSMIEAYVSTDIDEIWFEMMFEDLLTFDPAETKKSNITMALIHTLVGNAKRRRFDRAKRKPAVAHGIAQAVLDNYL